jgi:hypothetical protein
MTKDSCWGGTALLPSKDEPPIDNEPRTLLVPTSMMGSSSMETLHIELKDFLHQRAIIKLSYSNCDQFTI